MVFGYLPAIGPVEVIILLSPFVLVVWPAWRISGRLGYPGPLGLLALVPGLNIALLFWLAYAEWPAIRRDASGPDARI